MQNITFNQINAKFSAFLLALTLTALVGCGSPPSAGGTTTSTSTAATLQLSASSTTVPSDNSATTTITVTALNASNAALSGIDVSLATDTGILSTPSVTTGVDGTATFTFRSGTASLANRTATITASAGATAQIQVLISGSTLSVFSTSGSSVPNDGTQPVDVTFIAKNAQGTGLANVPYTASWVTTTGGGLTITPTSGVTDSAGKFTLSVAGTAAVGAATVMASAGGSSASATITVSAAAGTFGITQTSNSTGPVVTVNPTVVPMKIGDALTVTVSAPTSANVLFNTAMGTWSVSGTTSQLVAVAGGVATATLMQTTAGTANVQVNDSVNTALTDNITVNVTAVTPNSITLTASPSVVAKSIGSTTGTSTLIAKVLDAAGQPVGNAPVAFSMTNTTGGGETISPVVAYTAAIAGGGLGLGEASATFTSGSLSSSNSGVQVRASVLGTAVATEANLPAPLDLTASGNDAAIVVGGTAGSIAFGIATKIVELSVTTYKLPMSVLVSDSNGNPQANQVVNLSAWPSAWSTGTNIATPCKADADDGATKGTFYNEDLNGNLTLDAGEDGFRAYFATGALATGTGTMDGSITAINSAAGNLPSSVITDANGLANFDLVYLKTSAIWTVDTIRASTVVQGTEAVSQITFRLPAADADTAPICYLASPYQF